MAQNPVQPGALEHIVWPGGMTWQTQALQEEMPRNAARRLVNFFPYPYWLEMRGGYVNRWILPEAGVMFLPVDEADVLHIATDTKICSVRTFDPDGTTATEEVTGLTSGDWSWLNTRTPGGQFFLCVNGSDPMHVYDGAWHNVATDPTYTVNNIDTKKLTHIWPFKTRVFAIEVNSTRFWYSLPDAIVGDYTAFECSTIFRRGGYLVSGTSLSIDAGDGLDDRLVLFTSEGEIAIYEGTDPADANNWRLAGVYQTSPLLHKSSYLHVAGDLWLITREGIISLAAVIREGERATQTANFVLPIIDEWHKLAILPARDARWSVTYTPGNEFVLISPGETRPGAYTLVINVATRALSRIDGWPYADRIVRLERLFAINGTSVSELGVGGSDAGVAYEAQVCAGFTGAEDLRATKVVHAVDVTFDANGHVTPTLAVSKDLACYAGGDRSVIHDILDQPEWDVSAWDVTAWAYSLPLPQHVKRNVGGVCRTFSPYFGVRSNQNEQLRLRLHSMGVWYRRGNSL